MTVAEAIADWLAAKNVTHAFGIIGGGNVAIWQAIHALGKTELVSVHHEQAAAQAASYYYRASHRVALCLVTTGAGSSNALTGVLAAWMDSIPLLVISGNEPLRLWGESDERVLGTQGYRSAELVSPIVKAAFTITVPQEATRRLDYCLRLTEKERPGPCWVDIPKDIQLCAL